MRSHSAHTLVLGLVLALATTAFTQSIDLGDIAVGGDGTGSAEVGLGLQGNSGVLVPSNQYGGTTYGGPRFIRTDGSNGTVNLPYVNGVFVPDGLTQVASSGTTFSFPATSGTQLDAMRNAKAFVHTTSHILYPIQLPDHPGVDRRGLGMHANTGITYDLDALRTAGYAFSAVSGVAGYNYTAYVPDVDFEIWVLVDGVQQYRREFSHSAGAYNNFSISLPNNAHLLTIASTDNRNPADDHAVIADLALVPEPATLLLVVVSAALLRRR